METQTKHREAVETPVAVVFQNTSSPGQPIFCKEGEYWAIGYGRKYFRLKDTKGLGYLAHLLHHPGVEFHVLDLAGGIASQREKGSQSTHGLPRGAEDLEKAGIHIGSLGDAGEMLDEQAKIAYRRRLSELREELEEAKQVGNIERAESAEQEIDALTSELSRAVGLGGRNRRAASASERARQSITKTIKAVLDRIAQSDATLGDLFSRCIKTGNFCSYQPDPDFPIAWEFAATIVEPARQPASSGAPGPARADHPQASPVVLAASPLSLAERDGYSENNAAFVRTLEELIRMEIRPLKLGGLSKAATAQMLYELSQRQAAPESLVSLIFEETQGYPVFVEEVYRHLLEEGKLFDAAGQFRAELKLDESDDPENVRLIISRRLERLDDNEKRMLAAAAVIGRSFSFQLLTAASQIDVDELFTVIEKTQQMGIIVPSSDGPERPFTFRHELVRQTVLAAISAPRQQQMHARVAEAIERLNPDAANERAGEIVDHLLKAGSFADSQKLVRWLTLAGKNALDTAAFEEARSSFRIALSHEAAVGIRERADLLTSFARAERGLDQWDAALPHLREVVEIYINLDDREMIGRSFIELTDAFIWAGRFHEAAETARRG